MPQNGPSLFHMVSSNVCLLFSRDSVVLKIAEILETEESEDLNVKKIILKKGLMTHAHFEILEQRINDCQHFYTSLFTPLGLDALQHQLFDPNAFAHYGYAIFLRLHAVLTEHGIAALKHKHISLQAYLDLAHEDYLDVMCYLFTEHGVQALNTGFLNLSGFLALTPAEREHVPKFFTRLGLTQFKQGLSLVEFSEQLKDPRLEAQDYISGKFVSLSSRQMKNVDGAGAQKKQLKA